MKFLLLLVLPVVSLGASADILRFDKTESGGNPYANRFESVFGRGGLNPVNYIIIDHATGCEYALMGAQNVPIDLKTCTEENKWVKPKPVEPANNGYQPKQ